MTVLHVTFQAQKVTEQKSLKAQRPLQNSPFDTKNAALKTLTMKSSIQSYIGDAFTSSNFASVISDPELDLFHYHGHFVFKEQKAR